MACPSGFDADCAARGIPRPMDRRECTNTTGAFKPKPTKGAFFCALFFEKRGLSCWLSCWLRYPSGWKCRAFPATSFHFPQFRGSSGRDAVRSRDLAERVLPCFVGSTRKSAIFQLTLTWTFGLLDGSHPLTTKPPIQINSERELNFVGLPFFGGDPRDFLVSRTHFGCIMGCVHVWECTRDVLASQLLMFRHIHLEAGFSSRDNM